jgi:hypothetical protein
MRASHLYIGQLFNHHSGFQKLSLQSCQAASDNDVKKSDSPEKCYEYSQIL